MISNLGTQISLFGLGLWLFKADGRLGSFALVAVVVQLSRLVVMRVLVRRLARWPRRRVMLCANAVGAAGTLGLAAVLSHAGADISPVPVIPFLAVAAGAEAALVLSFSTLIPQLVPLDQRAQANGMFATADGLVALVAPFFGALLVAWTGMTGVVVLDACTFLAALGCVAIGRWPRQALRPLLHLEAEPPDAEAGMRSSLGQVLQQSRLRALLLLGAALMLSFASAEILFPAWVLQLPAGRSQLATALGLSGLAYGFGMAVWGRLANRPELWSWVFRLGLTVQSVALVGAGIPRIAHHLGFWFAGVAAFNVAVPLVLASQQNLWQRWVPIAQQPQFFAARYATDWMARLVAVVAVGPLVDRVLQPMLASSGAGRPMAVALSLLGLLLALMLFLHFRAFPAGDEKLPPCAS